MIWVNRTAQFIASFGGKDLLAKARERYPTHPTVSVFDMSPWRIRGDDGSKYPGSYGPTGVLWTDYWTLRARSAELFNTNLYARGLIRRLVTNVVNVGLHLEATPEERILGLRDDALADWSEDVENRFSLWSADEFLCDHDERLKFGSLQAMAYREALVSGDVLCVLRQDQRTKLPRIQLINGAKVQSPMQGTVRSGSRIDHGVEIDRQGRHVAYWVVQIDGSTKRLPAFGEKSGRRISWLLYGSDRRVDDVRGRPILSMVLSSLREIDRYRDATQRKAVINSMLAMFVKKEKDKPGSKSITRSATSNSTDTNLDAQGKERTFNVSEFIPGLVIDELQVGEEPVGFPSHGIDEKFGEFEEAMIQSIAWTHEIPPEIMRLAFSSNYSASQAANSEFNMFLNKERTVFAEQFCEPVYDEWLVAQTMLRKIEAPGLLEAWRTPFGPDSELLGAWLQSDWAGQIKPSIDPRKLVDAYNSMIDSGLMTRARAVRELTGLKYSKVIKQLEIENQQYAEAMAPLIKVGLAGKVSAGRPPQQSEPSQGDDNDDDASARSLTDGRRGGAAEVVRLLHG